MKNDEPGANADATIDRITRDMLHQLELQTQAALAILECAPEEKRAEVLAKIADIRGRLMRLRAEILGHDQPVRVVKDARAPPK